MRRIVLLVAIGLALAAPAGGVTRTGLYGEVTKGPLTPVCTAETPCYGPAPGVRLSFVRNGVVAARVVTNQYGRYVVKLAAGTYAVRGPRRLEPDAAHVVAGRMLRLDFSFDTGIR